MLKIGNFLVGQPDHCMIVAEIGINHNGDVHQAKLLIDAAHKAGCHAVKFQKRTVDIVYSPEELAVPREVPSDVINLAIKRGVLSKERVAELNETGETTNGDLKRALELTQSEYKEIDEYCKSLGILWFASPWDELSVDFLEQFNPPCHKVASASLTDSGLLNHLRKTGRPIILSTGMSDVDMIAQAVGHLDPSNLVILHCTSVYPTFRSGQNDRGLSMINLRGMKTLQDMYPGIPIGFSSHDLGIKPAYASAVLGAVMIEKHLTLFRGMFGSDQASSIEADDMARLVRAVEELPLVMGDGDIKFYDEERPVAKKLRRVSGD
ncbi:N-acetylneuraminate synthase family protein [Patescibacteria group bacterium]|nr:N-acetylneuraminate synthase family protein [Patescibacteria group bacterium]MBU1755029.1 N-acetylneuraminate synthase family protein [Patescibacteria group bacterium]